MDPLVNAASVDAFFDNPAAAGFGGGFDGGFEPADGAVDQMAQDLAAGSIGETEFYQPSAVPPTPQATPAEPVAPQVLPVQAVDFAAENAALRQQLAELQLYKPLGDMIQRNPQFLQAVESSLQQSAAQPAAPAEPKLERPTAPVKPANFDPSEAYVPGTPSFAFRESQEQYQAQMLDYFDKREEMREQTVQRQQAEYQQRMAQQQAHTQLSQELTTKYGYKPEQVQDFIQTMSDPSSRSLANLVALHAIQRRAAAVNVAGATQAAQKNVPLPVGVVGGNGGGQTPKPTDSDAFNMGLMSARH